MTRPSLALLAAALACIAAAPAKAPPSKAPTPKAAAKPAAAKPAAPKPTAPAAYDAQDPQSLIALLTDAGAKAQPGRRDADAMFVAVTSTAANFSVQFAGCDRSGRNCQAALYDALLDVKAPTLVQVNGFNQTSVTCRVYLDQGNKPHVVYSAVLLKSDVRKSAETHLAAWQGCIVEARNFVTDPTGYLANAA
jgi:hypothetical protein